MELGDDFIIQYRSLKTAICIALFSFVKLDLYFDVGNYIITPGVKKSAGIATIGVVPTLPVCLANMLLAIGTRSVMLTS